MTLKLPKALLDGLPAPDTDGLIHCKATLKLAPDGEASIVSLNGSPLDQSDDDSPSSNLPDLGEAEAGIYTS